MAVKCRCGGSLVKSQYEVEFFGIDFGVKKCEICKECNAEYLDDETMEATCETRNLYPDSFLVSL